MLYGAFSVDRATELAEPVFCFRWNLIRILAAWENSETQGTWLPILFSLPSKMHSFTGVLVMVFLVEFDNRILAAS